MTDVSITPANVLPVTGYKGDKDGLFGATVVQGKVLYKDASDLKWKLADNNVSAALALASGIALSAGSDGQAAHVFLEGDIDIGGTLVLGETYILSATAGGLAPVADISTNYVTVVGVAISTSRLRVKFIVSGIQHGA